MVKRLFQEISVGITRSDISTEGLIIIPSSIGDPVSSPSFVGESGPISISESFSLDDLISIAAAFDSEDSISIGESEERLNGETSDRVSIERESESVQFDEDSDRISMLLSFFVKLLLNFDVVFHVVFPSLGVSRLLLPRFKFQV